MNPMDRVNLTDLSSMGKRHREERERCDLSFQQLHHLTLRFSVPRLKQFEKTGKLPSDAFAFYLCSIAVLTEMDVLYILCGEYLPIRSSTDDKRLWALLSRLTPGARDAVLAEVERVAIVETREAIRSRDALPKVRYIAGYI